MIRPLTGKALIAEILATVVFVLSAAAQDKPAAAPAASAPTATTAKSTDSNKPALLADPAAGGKEAAKSALSPGVADIVKMLEAGVSADVIQAYVENSPATFKPSPADLIALKEHGVSDEVTKTLLKQGAENRTGAAQASAPATASPPDAEPEAAPAAAPSYTIRVVNSDRLDPESYEYFQDYYLYPRTLANVYQTLGYNPNTYGPIGFTPGYGPAYPSGYHVRGGRYGSSGRGLQTFPRR